MEAVRNDEETLGSVGIVVELGLQQFRQQVEATLGRAIARSTFDSWRSFLGLKQAPYTLRHVECMSIFAYYMAMGCRKAGAKKQMILKIKEKYGNE